MTITLTREEAQRVLDALVNWDARGRLRLIETLRARLEQSKVAREGPVREWARISQAEPEPVMLMDAPLLLNGQPLYTTPPQFEPEPVADKYLMEVECTKCGAKEDGVLTVTAPPQREWQGLTDEEANELCFASVEEIEAKLREKNI